MNASLRHHLSRSIVLALLFGLLTVFALSANAQSPAIPTFDRMTLNHLDRIISGTPGISSVGIANGVNVSASGAVNVTSSNGVRIPVPTTATATINKAAMAAAAAKAIRAASVIGAAYTAYEVYKWVEQSGLTTCPPPDFFCKAAVGSTPTYTYRVTGSTFYQTVQAACTAAGGSLNSTSERCIINGNFNTIAWQAACASPYVISGSVGGQVPVSTSTSCVLPAGTSAPVGGPYTQPELETAISGTNWDAARSQKMMDALIADMPRMPGVYTNADIKPGMSSVNIVASPVTTPRTTVKKDTVVTGDGRTLEVKTEEQITIIPNLAAMNRLDSKSSSAEFKEQMTRFTGETDLATGITTPTKTEVLTPTATATPTTPAPTTEEQTGPRECGTPGKPRCQIDESGTPDAAAATDSMTKGNQALDKVVSDWKLDLGNVTSSEGKDTSIGWFPALPAGTCQPFILSAKLPPVDWCPVVPRLKDMMQWMWAMLTIFACMHMVNNTMKGN